MFHGSSPQLNILFSNRWDTYSWLRGTLPWRLMCSDPLDFFGVRRSQPPLACGASDLSHALPGWQACDVHGEMADRGNHHGGGKPSREQKSWSRPWTTTALGMCFGFPLFLVLFGFSRGLQTTFCCYHTKGCEASFSWISTSKQRVSLENNETTGWLRCNDLELFNTSMTALAIFRFLFVFLFVFIFLSLSHCISFPFSLFSFPCLSCLFSLFSSLFSLFSSLFSLLSLPLCLSFTLFLFLVLLSFASFSFNFLFSSCSFIFLCVLVLFLLVYY